MVYEVFNIQYDTDGEQIELPKTLTITVSEDCTGYEDVVDFISDEITDTTGFCHLGFDTNPKIIYESKHT